MTDLSASADTSPRQNVTVATLSRRGKNISEDQMTDDVVTLYGNCQAEPCKRGDDVKITDENDKVRVGDKDYHKGCEPTLEERAAKNRA